MARMKSITLCWYAKVGAKWQYFPVLLETVHGLKQPRHGWVMHRGVEVNYPIGRYVLRSYKEGRKVYTAVDSPLPAVAMISLVRARRASFAEGISRDPRKLIKSATVAYIRDCKAQRHLEAAGQ